MNSCRPILIRMQLEPFSEKKIKKDDKAGNAKLVYTGHFGVNYRHHLSNVEISEEKDRRVVKSFKMK